MGGVRSSGSKKRTMVFPEWLRVIARQDPYLIKYGLQRKIFEKRMELKGATMLDVLENWAKIQPAQKLLIQDENIITYQGMVDSMNQRGRALYDDVDIRYGSKIALFQHNRPEFVSSWYGGVNIGAVPAFVNNNLRLKQLEHCFNISDSEAIIVDGAADNLEALYDIRDKLAHLRILVDDADCQLQSDQFERFVPMFDQKSKEPIPRSLGRDQIKMSDPFCLIFTSGTTGLPKAAPYTHQAAMKSCTKMMIGMKPGEVAYTALPLYHTFASQVGVTGAVIAGASVAIAPKFSATNFWKDCVKYDAEYIFYIGEMLRYCLDAPPSEWDKKHKIKAALGSGLRYDIWPKMAPRFGDMWMFEIYGSTEGNIQLANILNDESCICRLTPMMKAALSAEIVKYDPIEEAVITNDKGYAIKADWGETGLLIGKIRSDLPFNGYYNDQKKSDEKILKDVFKNGDQYFNTGDLLKRDADYKLRFMDRVGDTYRWKGENVSTVEVGNTMADNNPFLVETNCYGVKVPWAEGACGALAITLDTGDLTLTAEQLQSLYDTAIAHMPGYQRPMFIRVQAEMEATGTFKNRKVELVKEGFNFAEYEDKDAVYFLSKQEAAYIPLTQSMVDDINSGALKF